RNPPPARVRPAARRLSRPAPLLVHGALDPRLRLVSELPPAAALPQRRNALHARAGARGLRAAHRPPARPPAERGLATAVPQPRGGHPQDEPLLLARRAQARRQA